MPAEPPTILLANVRAHAAGLLLFAGRLALAEAQAIGALETARAVGARAEEAVALGVLGWVEVVRGEADRGRRARSRGVAIARELAHVTGLAVAYNHLAAVLDIAGRVRESLEVAQEGIVVAERLGIARSFGALLEGNAAHALLRLGRWDEAAAMTDAALARGTSPGALAWLRIVRARLDVARGQFAAAEGELRALEAAADPAAIAPYFGWWYVARAEQPPGRATRARPGHRAGLVRRPAAAVDRRLDREPGRARVGAAADMLESEPAGRRAPSRGPPVKRSTSGSDVCGGRAFSTPDLPIAGPSERSGPATAKVALVEAEASRLVGRGGVATGVGSCSQPRPRIGSRWRPTGAIAWAPHCSPGSGSRSGDERHPEAHTMAVGLGLDPWRR